MEHSDYEYPDLLSSRNSSIGYAETIVIDSDTWQSVSSLMHVFVAASEHDQLRVPCMAPKCLWYHATFSSTRKYSRLVISIDSHLIGYEASVMYKSNRSDALSTCTNERMDTVECLLNMPAPLLPSTRIIIKHERFWEDHAMVSGILERVRTRHAKVTIR